MEPIPVFQGDIVEFTHGKYPKKRFEFNLFGILNPF